MSYKSDLFICVGNAKHFLRWEVPELQKYFNIVDSPSPKTILLSFGPDVLDIASKLPALKRFAVTFPGFSQNPLRDMHTRERHNDILKNFDAVFINPGPLETAYSELNNIELYPFSVDMNLVTLKRYRNKLTSLLHVSGVAPQKDWERSESIMKLTGLKYEVYPPRNEDFYSAEIKRNEFKNKLRRKLGIIEKKYLPHGYVTHEKVVKKYQSYDGFVHIANDVKHIEHIDGKYTASLIEAGVTGSILFWHDTYKLGNGLETVFDLSVEPEKAAKEILEISKNIDIKKHSKLTREEMIDTFNVQNSIGIRAKSIIEKLG
ncbi:MAG: hypothetical protein V9G25_00285 [Acidimicrobiia bacterium]